MMKILVDADACPVAAKEIIFRAARRLKIETILVANTPLNVPPDDNISNLVIEKGFDVADSHIVQMLKPGDLVITADIPLAADAVDGGALVIDFRGHVYSEENVRERLYVRDFMDNIRKSGAITGGPPPYGKTDRMAFANQLDRTLTRLLADG